MATGVGKTYVLAATIEYLAADGVRDFVVITPGRTVSTRRSRTSPPVIPRVCYAGWRFVHVVTSENFATPAIEPPWMIPTRSSSISSPCRRC